MRLADPPASSGSALVSLGQDDPMTVLLVRHAEPEVVPSVAPQRWALSEAGRLAAAALSARLPVSGVWVSSMENKAYETLCCAGGDNVPITQDRGFDEVHRDEPFDDGFQARRLAWVEGRIDERHTGWETPREAAARFDRAVARHAASSSPLVVASHGMALTAWLVHGRRLLPPRDAGEFWMTLALPDVVEVT